MCKERVGLKTANLVHVSFSSFRKSPKPWKRQLPNGPKNQLFQQYNAMMETSDGNKKS
jgi:hypothetical protein